MMAQSTRLKNKLEKVLKRLVYIGSTRPISFNIDKMIECLSVNGFPTESKVKNHNLYYHEAFLKYAGRELYDLSFKMSNLKKRL